MSEGRGTEEHTLSSQVPQNESNEIGLVVTGNCFQRLFVYDSFTKSNHCDVKLLVLKDLLTNLIVGQDILKLHDRV